MLVAGLDRLDGSVIDGMPDDLWALHTAEIRSELAEVQKTEPGTDFGTFCRRYMGGDDLTTQAMRTFLVQAPPLAVLWDSDGTLVASEAVIIEASNRVLEARGLPRRSDAELKAGFHMPTAERLASLLPAPMSPSALAGSSGGSTVGATTDTPVALAAEFYAAATQLAEGDAMVCAGPRAPWGVGAVLEALAQRRVALAVVSNSLRSFVLQCLLTVGVLPYFAAEGGEAAGREWFVDGEDSVPAHKPDPRGILQSMRQLGVRIRPHHGFFCPSAL
jgi:beta-phosphoglucomutase-like phosphatase (HAD superfamily)